MMKEVLVGYLTIHTGHKCTMVQEHEACPIDIVTSNDAENTACIYGIYHMNHDITLREPYKNTKHVRVLKHA